MSEFNESEVLEILGVSEKAIYGHPLNYPELISGIRELGELASLGVVPGEIVELIDNLKRENMKLRHENKRLMESPIIPPEL